MRINIIRGILIILLLETCWLIFGFSSQNAEQSSGISMDISKGIIDLVKGNESDETKLQLAQNIEHIIRKLAHFLIYTIVGVLLMSLASTYNLTDKRKIIISLVAGFLYACSDEIHQLFVSGRSGEIRDVLIDTSGILFGTLICIAILKLSNKYMKKKEKIA